MKKRITTFLLGMFLGLTNYGQTVHLTKDTTLSAVTTFPKNLYVDHDIVVQNEATITVSDTLFVFGKLVNDGKIQARCCLVADGEIVSVKSNLLEIAEELHFRNAKTSSQDTVYPVKITAADIFIDDYTTMESGEITTKNLTIHDTLEFTGKLGVKTVQNNFSISENACFLNTDNENIRLYGNAFNNSSKQCKNANFSLFGENHFYGDFSCYRIDIDELANCINHGKITVKETFSGKGIFVQTENAYLCVNTPTSPKIDASATGNTLEYTRGGIQELGTDECYNLVLSKNGENELLLTCDTKVNQLTIKKKSFLNCNGNTLELTHTQPIVVDDTKSDKGILLQNGTLKITNLLQNKPLQIPLFTNEKHIAALTITNVSDSQATITIDSVFNYVTNKAISNGRKKEYEFVNLTWHITSTNTETELTLFWDSADELPYFEPFDCTIYHYEENKWKDIEISLEKSQTTATCNANGYFTIGNKLIVLPIRFSNFACKSFAEYNCIEWESNPKFSSSIEKSYDGMQFFTIAESSQTPYVDYDIHHPIVYYRIATTDDSGAITYSDIQSIIRSTYEEIRITKNRIQYIGNEEITKIILYDMQGKITKATQEKILTFANIPKGTYVIVIQTNKTSITQKICLF